MKEIQYEEEQITKVTVVISRQGVTMSQFFQPRFQKKALLFSIGFISTFGLGSFLQRKPEESEEEVEPRGDDSSPMEEDVLIMNWSGNHLVNTKYFYTPETEKQVQEILDYHQARALPIRPSGTALSPNGLSLHPSAMISLSSMNSILEVDNKTQLVRVQPGITVERFSKKLADSGLTMQNFASIREQQVAGLVQAGAHGTGLTIPPLDEQVQSFTVITPGKGRVEISREHTPEEFALMNVGLGCFGVVTEMVLKCVADHHLREETLVKSWQHIQSDHRRDLLHFRHLRYLWIPYTREAVVIRSNETRASEAVRPQESSLAASANSMGLLLQEYAPGTENLSHMNIPKMRDQLLAINCSDPHWVARINAAELEAWKTDHHQVSLTDRSDEILGFDCGGQQLVFEVCFPIGDPRSSDYSAPDLQFTRELMALIEKENLPAPSPIEQRYSARSTSRMSPAYSEDPNCAFSWVGIIVYLPTEAQREEATAIFERYRMLMLDNMADKYDLRVHWAKIEPPSTPNAVQELRDRISRSFPMQEFNTLRKEYDPSNLMVNDLLKQLF